MIRIDLMEENDNNDEGDDGSVKRNRSFHGVDSPKRRSRYDSENDNKKHSRKNHRHYRPRRSRHRFDSDDDSSEKDGSNQGRRQNHSKDEITTTKRHDINYGTDHTDGHSRRRRRRRHDSDDSDDKIDDQMGGDKRRDHHHKKRRRYDSHDDDDDHQSNRIHRSHQHDSHDDSSSDQQPQKTRRNQKHHSRHDSTLQSNNSNSNSNNEDDDNNDEPIHSQQQLMSSGHSAGLHNAKDFQKAESNIRRQQREQSKRFAQQMNLNDDDDDHKQTVYRDKHGRKLKHPPSNTTTNKDVLTSSELIELNMGQVQKQQILSQAQRIEQMTVTPFARMQEDTELEQARRNVIHQGDPMASYAIQKHQQQKQQKQEENTQSNSITISMPIYKGPPPKPNRFQIRPGYRWDGIDRGNGFEDKVLTQIYSKGQQKEVAYQWSSADM